MAEEMLLRCRHHDYQSRCIYMITLMKNDGFPTFSRIEAAANREKLTPVVRLSPIGKLIYSALSDFERQHAGLKILRRQAMPDHLHFELFVMERTEDLLGGLIAAFKAQCTQSYRRSFPESPFTKARLPLFRPGFNDKIAFSRGSKNAFYNYIADNPRRYLIRKLYPEYFGNRLDLCLGGERLHLYGNFLLLENPVKSTVKISRRVERTPDLDARTREWNEVIRCGGALVSPFINGAEKRFRDRAIKSGSPVILIQNYAYTERSKPHKMLFELCEKGQLLIISKGERTTVPESVSYPEAQEMNRLALAVARLQPGEAILKRRAKALAQNYE